WYFLNTLQKEVFIAPYNQFIGNIAEDVMSIFEDEYEYAPENEVLKKFYTLDQTETDYYEVRNFIDTILFKSYLFFPDTGLKLLHQEAELIEDEKEHLLMYLREMRDDMVHKSYTSLLSLNGKEWAAELLENGHPLKK